MADTIQGLTIGLGLNTAGVDESLKSLRAKLKYMNSEMAANMSAFDRGEKSVQKYQTQLTGLNRKLDVQKATTAAARVEYERMVAQHGEGSTQAQRAATALNNEVAAVNNLERHVESLTTEMQQFQAEQEAANSTMGQLSTSLATAGGHMKKFGDGMKTAGKNMSMYVTAPLVGLGAASVKTAMDFEAQMSRVGAIAGATAEEMDQLRDSALELGASTSKSASEVAIAQEGLAAMGFTTQEILGAMPGVISAAESSGADMAQTADVMASALNIFGLEASEATRVADILAQTANQSAADITDMQYALKYAGGPAAALGVSLEELSASIGIMTDAGLTGENAGTALRGALLGLLDPSEENSKLMEAMGVAITDNEGNFVGISKLIENLSGSMEGMTETQKAANLSSLVGREAVSGMLALMSAGPKEIDKMTKSLEESGGASAETAKKMKDNLAGAIDELGGAFETAAITIGTTLTPAVHKVTGFIQGLLEKFQGMSPAGQKAAVMFAGIAAAAGPVLIGLGFMVSALGSVVTFLGSAAGAIAIMGTGVAASTPLIGGLATAFTVLTGPIGIAVAAIAGIGIATGLLVKHMSEDAIPEIDRFGEGVSESTQKALGSFFELSDGASQSLMDMRINGTTVTKEMASELVTTYEEMNGQILESMKTRYAEENEEMKAYFANSAVLSKQEENKILMEKQLQQEKDLTQQQLHEDQIQLIVEKAATEKRELTEAELIKIDKLHQEMNEAAVVYLSENELEQKIIMERMASSADELSAKQAATITKNSADARDKVIADAETKFIETVGMAIRERDETGSITAEQAQKIIDEATRTKDESVKKAEEMHSGVVEEAKLQAGEHVDQVDWSTGEILSKWDVYKKGVIAKFKDTNRESMEDFKRWGGNIKAFAVEMKDDALRQFDKLVAGAAAIPGKIKTGINNAKGLARAGIASLGNSMVGKFGSVVNGLIGGVNTVTGKLGIKSKISLWDIPEFHKGTESHKGGPMIVGDKFGRELVQFPNGKVILSPDTDTLIPNAPKGTRVLPNKITEKVLKGDVPMFNKGTGIKDFLGDIWNYATNPSKLISDMIGKLGLSIDGLAGASSAMAKGAFSLVKQKSIDYIKNMFASDEVSAGNGQGFGPQFRLTSRRGWRIHPITGLRTFHQGDDWGAPMGTPIASQASGQVTFSGYQGARGNTVRIKSGPYEHLYQHNSRNLVGVGQIVRKGQAIGLVGSTGASTGPHLHHELKRNGINVNPSGLATGGLIQKEQMVTVGEGGRDEVMIPLHPSRRTDAMKLLALAAKRIGGSDNGITRPNQLPNVGGSGDSQVVELLKQQVALLTSLISSPQMLTVQIPINGDVVAEKTFNTNDRLFGGASNKSAWRSGVRE